MLEKYIHLAKVDDVIDIVGGRLSTRPSPGLPDFLRQTD